MWVGMAIVALIAMILALVWQRWKVSSEWLRMERELSDEEYQIWKRNKQRDAEEWSERWKGAEAAFLMILSLAMVGLWFLIP